VFSPWYACKSVSKPVTLGPNGATQFVSCFKVLFCAAHGVMKAKFYRFIMMLFLAANIAYAGCEF
jgi:hypothetical protein